MEVLATTNGGDGVRSAPIHCQTEQDGKLNVNFTKFNLSLKMNIVSHVSVNLFHSSRSASCCKSPRHGLRLNPCVMETTSAAKRCRNSLQCLYSSSKCGATSQQGMKITSDYPMNIIQTVNDSHPRRIVGTCISNKLLCNGLETWQVRLLGHCFNNHR